MSTPDATADLALPALPSRDAWARQLRRLALPAAGAVALVVALVALGGPLETFADALRRAVNADAKWVGVAAVFEVLSFTGYVLLFWHVAGRASSRLGVGASYQITLAGAATTRLMPTGGAGGVAVALWALRRSGLGSAVAGRVLLSFLVVLYSVFFSAIAVAGLAMAGEGPVALTVLPAALAITGILGALVLGLRTPPTADPGTGRTARVRRGARVLGDGVRDALVIVRGADPRIGGALIWWGFDVAVMWSVFQALGEPPALGVIVIGYFVGQVANTLPLPGAVSGGMVGVLLAFGVPADMAIASVLAYRAVALWLPAPAGIAAIVQLRRTVTRWSREEETPVPAPVPVRASRPEAAPLAARVAVAA